MTKTYRVTGMSCDSCVRAVTIAIRKRAPKAAVSVDLDSGLVKVDADLAEAEIRGAVENAGFKYEGVAA